MVGSSLLDVLLLRRRMPTILVAKVVSHYVGSDKLAVLCYYVLDLTVTGIL